MDTNCGGNCIDGIKKMGFCSDREYKAMKKSDKIKKDKKEKK